MRGRVLIAAAAAALALPIPAGAGAGMVVGAAEDNVRQPTLLAAKAKMTLLQLLGLQAIRVTTTWVPGQEAPPDAEVKTLENVLAAADLAGIDVYLVVMNPGSRTTPLSAEHRTQFARNAAALARALPTLRKVVVGNEPNLNRYWLPQFGVDGRSASPAAYLELLAETYDALKEVEPAIEVLGGALAPRGEDNPRSIRHTHSPTRFVRELGAAFRASGRSRPVMDAIAMHVYQDNSSLPPAFQHPRTTTIALGDYAKLTALLGAAFDGTAQAGSALPIYYTEYGVEAQIPAEKASLYTGRELPATRPVDEATQAKYYAEALALAFCQPNVRGIFFFHTVDEPDLDRWQSGVYYADDSPKTSAKPVGQAVRATRGGSIARCEGMQLTPRLKVTLPATPGAGGRFFFTLECSLDCSYVARLEKLPSHATVAELRGKALVGVPTKVTFRSRRLAAGTYRYTVRAVHPVNVGPATRTASREFRVRPAG